MSVPWRRCIRSGSRLAAACAIISPCPIFLSIVAGSSYDLPGGYIHNGDLAGVKGFQTASDPIFRQSVSEDVMHAYYQGDKAVASVGGRD